MASRDSLEEEFREFVAARSAALLRTAYLLTGDWATAEDLLQTALTKTYLAWKRLGGIEAVEPYARRVLVNTSTSWWRRRWHGERPTEVLPERAGADEIERAARPRPALAACPGAAQPAAGSAGAALLRGHVRGADRRDAGHLAGTVKSQTSRALATLRRRLGADAAELAAAGIASRPPAAAVGRDGAGGRTTARVPGADGSRPPVPLPHPGRAVGRPTRAPPDRSAPRRAASDRPAGRAAHRPGGRARRHGLRGPAVSESRGRHDNLTDGPARSYQVRPDELEGAVRETLSHQVSPCPPAERRSGRPGHPPREPDPASTHRGRPRPRGGHHRAAQRRHGPARCRDQAGTGTPIVVIGDPDPAGRPLPTASIPGTAPLARDVGRPARRRDAGQRRRAAAGAARRRAGRTRPARCPAAAVGWWSARRPPQGAPSGWCRTTAWCRCCWPGRARSSLAPDSLQVAWRDGGDLLVAGVVGTQLIGSVRTPVPAAAEPVRFVGDSVLVRLDPAGAGHTLWRPGAGPLPEALDRKSLNVYGRLPDGRLVGQVAATDPGRTCLAVLDPDASPGPGTHRLRSGPEPGRRRRGLAGRAVAAGEREDRRGRPVRCWSTCTGSGRLRPPCRPGRR